MTAIASATKPASRASATAPGGGGDGRRGPPGRCGLDPPARPVGRLERLRLLEELERLLVVEGAHDRANPTAPGRTA